MSAPICTTGALAQQPRHSTSSQEKHPSRDSSSGFSAICSLQISINASEPRSMHGVVPHTQIWAVVPTGCQLEHRIEGRDLEHADVGHAQHVGDGADGGLGAPALLLLGAPSSASTAEACLPGGYLAISVLAHARFSGVKAKLRGCSG